MVPGEGEWGRGMDMFEEGVKINLERSTSLGLQAQGRSRQAGQMNDARSVSAFVGGMDGADSAANCGIRARLVLSGV